MNILGGFMLRITSHALEQSLAAHDNLDLPALIAQGRRYRRGARGRLLRMVAIVLILLVPTATLTYDIAIPTTQVYRLDAGGAWSRFDLPMGNVLSQAETMVSGGNDSLWVLDSSAELISRQWNGNWDSYRSQDIGVALGAQTVLTAEGDELWGASGSDVFHFDGARWEVLPDVLPSEVPLAIAAGPYGVFVADGLGNLSRFWQDAWKHTNVVPTGSAWKEVIYEEQLTARFAQAPDGTIWLSYIGLWKFAGDGWIRVDTGDQWDIYAWLLGVTDDSVWYTDFYDVLRLSTASGEIEYFSPESIGAKDDFVTGGAVLDNQLWVMTDTALHVYIDSRWQTVKNLPGTAQTWFIDLVASGDDALYLTVYDPGTAYDPLVRSLGGLTLTLLAPLLLIAADFLLRYVPEWRQYHRRWGAMRTILAPLPEFDGESTPSNPWNVRRFLLGYFVQLVWLVIAMSGVTITLLQISNSARVGLVFAVGTSLGYVVARLFVSGYLLVLGDSNTRTNIRLLMHGEYDYLLERNGYTPEETDAQAAKHGSPIWQIYGLLLAGRHAQVLPLLQKTLRGLSAASMQNAAMLVANIGYCLMHMERNDDALPYFEATTRFAPDLMTGYMGLAHYYLNTESDPARALALIEAAAQFDERPVIRNALTNYGRLGRQMSHALALALNGRCDQGLALATQTAADHAMKLPVIAASTHADYGALLQRCGQPDEARAHLEQAQALDPNGSQGQRARKLLQEMDGSAAPVEDALAAEEAE